jgi:putative transposase
MKAVAADRRRFGSRRIHIMLELQEIVMNLKTLRRLYREEKLQVRRRGGRKRALGGLPLSGGSGLSLSA